jgi:hypothetical protein
LNDKAFSSERITAKPHHFAEIRNLCSYTGKLYFNMNSATISILKQELKLRPPEQLIAACIRLAKYKVENKELLTYLLFESENETMFIQSIKEEMEKEFAAINRSNFYLAKKSIRRLLKINNKYIRFSAQKTTEVELRLHFCRQLRKYGYYENKDTALDRMYLRQMDNIRKVLLRLNEDLQFDYGRELKSLL